jgi:2,5-diamino-6-(ribosylamino)-4(3H)-pyrimidinone 5'-phosphate reductase
MSDRPETTLFLLISVDGKITTGDTDLLDSDKDWKRIAGVKEGLQQYYDLEKQIDLHSLNSGRVMAKVGVNERTDKLNKIEISFIIIDNKPHLKESGVRFLANYVKTLYLVTTNKDHPVYQVADQLGNVVVMKYDGQVNLKDLFETLKREWGINRVTIQTGGTMNAAFLRQGLVDHVSLVVAPLLVGGKDTSTLVDGESLHTVEELAKVRALKLVKCNVIKDSYIHLTYDVVPETRIEPIQQ